MVRSMHRALPGGLLLSLREVLCPAPRADRACAAVARVLSNKPRFLPLLCSVLLALLPLGPAQAQTLPLPTGLPTHFGFGLSGHPDNNGIYGWMPDSGVAWDYAYQYLAGGVNTGNGWETWNPNGTFALSYAQGAASHGYIPMFPYYEMLQSDGPCGNCPENQKDLTHLNSADVMRAYFNNFALLMKRLGAGNHDGIQGFGKPALVNIEPDLTGYAQQAVLRSSVCFNFCTAEGNDANNLKAAVSSSGHPDVAGYPNTWAGFNQALLHLRDLYAPNVLLGFDISMFATGQDIGLNPDPNLDAAAYGRIAGQFAALSGVVQSAPNTSTYDVLFNTPLDRDAGQYRARFNQNRWWDRDNVTFPNFARWEQYLAAVRGVAGGKPILLWQVPVGNQYFQTENNTDNHFQDNRAEYIFGHVQEMIDTGIVGVMFGAGNAGSTNFDDGSKDGVTNPPALCTADGSSRAQICNDHPSTVADDDGGYLRMAGGAYYRAPVALTGVASAPAPAPNPAPAPAPAPNPDGPLQIALGASTVDPGTAELGQQIALRQDLTPSKDTVVLIDFELYDAQGQKVWQAFHDNLTLAGGAAYTDTAFLAVPDTFASGEYTLKTGIFAPGWANLYVWNDQAGTLTVP